MTATSMPDVEMTPLTYGVEIETVFAFHRDEIMAVLQNGEKPIILDTTTQEGDRFTRKPGNNHLKPRIYNSWGVKKGNQLERPYNDEPLKVARRKLQAKFPHIQIMTDMNAKEKNTSDKYDDWIITKDHTVPGVGSDKIPDFLQYVNKDESQNWDSFGIELISKVLNTDDDSHKQEIRDVVDTLKSTVGNKHGAFITSDCALHVHIQADAYQEDDFLTVLAALLLLYEEEISRLHPHSRRPEHPNAKGLIESNRLRLFLLSLATADETKDVNCSTAKLKRRRSIHYIRTQCQKQLNLRGRRDSLVRFMNFPTVDRKPIRDRVVNFVCTDRPPHDGRPLPKTVEFRQHAGSLDALEINRWVDFCVGMVRLAHHYTQHPDEFPVTAWDDEFFDGQRKRNRVCVFDLLRAMNADEDTIKYWEKKVAKHMIWDEGDEGDTRMGVQCYDPDGEDKNGPEGDTEERPDDENGNFDGTNQNQSSNPSQSQAAPPQTPTNSKRSNLRSSRTPPPAPKRVKTDKIILPLRPQQPQPPLSITSSLHIPEWFKPEAIGIEQRLGWLRGKVNLKNERLYKFEDEIWKYLLLRYQSLGGNAWDDVPRPRGSLRNPNSPRIEAELSAMEDRLAKLNPKFVGGSKETPFAFEVMERNILKRRWDELKGGPSSPAREDIKVPNLPPQSDLTENITTNTGLRAARVGDTFSVEQRNQIAGERMTKGEIYFYPTNFDAAKWTVEDTPNYYQAGSRWSVCGAYALFHSMNRQYLGSHWTRTWTFKKVLDALDAARRNFNAGDSIGNAGGATTQQGEHTEMEMAQALFDLTGNLFQLVIWDPNLPTAILHHPNERAHRVGVYAHSWGNNLYVHIRNEPQSRDRAGTKGRLGHWSSMSPRRPGTQTAQTTQSRSLRPTNLPVLRLRGA